MRRLSSVATGFLLVAALGATSLVGQEAASVQDALTRIGSQDFAGAVEVLERVVADDPTNARAWGVMASALQSLERTDGAIHAYERAIALPDAPIQYRFALGLLLARGSDPDRGFELLHEVKDSGRFNTTNADFAPDVDALRSDPRWAALFPSESDFAEPFVESVGVLREWVGEGRGDQFGWIARDIGDVDADGIRDVVTSAPTRATDGPSAGRVYVYSSRTGEMLWSADGAPGDQLGTGLEAAGDVNADGVPDVAAGAPGGEYARVYSGRDGAVIWEWRGEEAGALFGGDVTDVGDVDQDGHDDVLVGAAASSLGGEGAGSAFVYSGRTGELIQRWDGRAEGDAFGSTAGGSTTERGGTVIVVGAPNAGEGQVGAAYVYRGVGDTPAFVIQGDSSDAQLGAMFASAVGDVDADGIVDVYVSDWASNANGRASGRAYVYSTATGTLIHDLPGEASGDGFGIGVADVGDVDNDGADDLLIGAWQHAGAAPSGGKIYLYSGRTGELLREVTGSTMGETFGFDTTGLGDVNGDGAIDYLVTSAWSAIRGGRSGRVFILSGASPASP